MLPLLLFLFLAQNLQIDSVPNPRAHNEWVTDQAQIIEPIARDRLNSQIDRLNQEIGVEIAIVTVPSVSGVPREFALELFNDWGIGSAETNNGFLIFLAVSQRRLETITGTGLEGVLTDDWLQEMQDTEMVPLFRSGMFGAGLEAGMKAVEDHLRSAPGEMASPSPNAASSGLEPQLNAPAPGSASKPASEPLTTESAKPKPWYLWLRWILGAGFLIAATWFGARQYQAYRRSCRKCRVQMLHLDEVSDDEHLDKGQRKEEELGSVNYDVYICPGCQESRIVPDQKWFSGYIKCPNCNHKTNKRTTETIVHATTQHGGKVEVREKCENCRHRTAGVRYTARRSTTRTTSESSRSFSSSSSFGSSGSSFGGGSSRGGGAGSSW